ncbi:MAG: DUF456 domain-containing protein [Cyclonatronaceae bacterium]
MTGLICWILIVLLFILSFPALKYPFIPGFLPVIGAFAVYGFCFSFDPFGIFFWSVQIFFILCTFITDYVSNLYAVRIHGGSNAAVYGSLIGLVFGPFLIPFAGLVAGPFIGAVAAEWLINRKPLRMAFRAGLGALIGLAGSTFLKAFIQLSMIITFITWIVWNSSQI